MDSEPKFEVGDNVTDIEEIEDKDLAIVIKNPDMTIDEWVLEGPEDEPNHPDAYTVSDDNPNYDPDNRAVLVAFVESGLRERWPDWRTEYPDGLYEGVKEHGVKFYVFPENRLKDADEELVVRTLANASDD